jgi:lysine-N-methylase
MQNRSFSIEERLNILNNFYEQIKELHSCQEFDRLEELIEEFSSEIVDYEALKGNKFRENNEFYKSLIDEEFIKNIRSVKLKACIKEYKAGILKTNSNPSKEALNEEESISFLDVSGYLKEKVNYFKEVETYSYVFENYLVNQIFKDLVPFNKGESLSESVRILINSYRIIKAKYC